MADSKNFRNIPLTLRVKAHSEMDNVLRALLEAKEPLSAEQIKHIGGLNRSARLVRNLDKWFDNVRVVVERGDPQKHTRLSYIEINPQAPQSVGTDVKVVVKSDNGNEKFVEEGDDLHIQDVRWPQAPPMVESLGNVFREPSWFTTMDNMTKWGRHIALSGPPGVGKDTAVQELAATNGRVLVTVSGDAGFRRRDLVGSVNISHGKSFFEVAEYAAAVVNGWWVLLTEVNAADADALMFINAQLAPPYVINIAGKSYPVHQDFRLFVSYNPGLIGTKPLPQSFKDRFFSIKIPFFTQHGLKSLLVAHGMPEDAFWANVVVGYGMEMWKSQERGQLRYQVTTRRLMDAVELMTHNVCDDVKDALEMAVIGSIDSPIEAVTAKNILNTFINVSGGQ